jgi:beta-glucanase (GH16 family)
MWFIKDFFINLFLDIRLWFYVKFKPSRFKNVVNEVDKEGWELTFNDEFDQGKLDRKKWRTDAYYGLRFHPGNIVDRGEAPDSYYGDNMFEFDGSIMKQKADDNPITINYVDWDGKDWGKYTIPYRIGQIDSSNSFEQKYGYFEIRSKNPSEPGHWTAFWLASKHAWPPEIDIYEIYTGKKKGLKSFESNFHWNPSENKKMKVKGHKVLDVSEDFHLYAVEWNDKQFKIYYDNLLVRVFSNPETVKFFEHPMHIIINNGIDPREGRRLEDVKFPTYHEVDYVRAYKKRVKL